MGKEKPMQIDITNLANRPNGYYDNVRKDMLKYIPCDVRRTLEFGCGTGGISVLLKEKFGTESWAVEIDKRAAQKAEGKLDRVINADALVSLKEIPDNYFDCVVFFDVLEHLVDPYNLLCGIKAKLTKGGVVVASIPNIRYYRALVKLVIHGNWDYKEHGILDKTHLRFFTYKSLVKMFAQLDFEILKLEGIHSTSSRTFRLLNMFLFGSFSDAKYKHFAAVIRPK